MRRKKNNRSLHSRPALNGDVPQGGGALSGAGPFVFLCGNPEGGIIPVFPRLGASLGFVPALICFNDSGTGGNNGRVLHYRCSYLRQ